MARAAERTPALAGPGPGGRGRPGRHPGPGRWVLRFWSERSRALARPPRALRVSWPPGPSTRCPCGWSVSTGTGTSGPRPTSFLVLQGVSAGHSLLRRPRRSSSASFTCSLCHILLYWPWTSSAVYGVRLLDRGRGARPPPARPLHPAGPGGGGARAPWGQEAAPTALRPPRVRRAGWSASYAGRPPARPGERTRGKEVLRGERLRHRADDTGWTRLFRGPPHGGPRSRSFKIPNAIEGESVDVKTVPTDILQFVTLRAAVEELAGLPNHEWLKPCG